MKIQKDLPAANVRHAKITIGSVTLYRQRFLNGSARRYSATFSEGGTCFHLAGGYGSFCSVLKVAQAVHFDLLRDWEEGCSFRGFDVLFRFINNELIVFMTER